MKQEFLRLFEHKKHTRATLLLLFFCVFIGVGIRLSADYGVAWDDHLQTALGKQTYEYISGQNRDIFESPDQYYGTAFELPIYLIQKNFHDFKTQVYVRHLVSHLYFLLSVFFFYKITIKLFRSFPLALLAMLMLYLSPRLFAHSFFNTKDLPFLSTFIISLYTLYQLIKEPNSHKRILIHAFVTAFLIDIRLLGLLIPALTIGLIGINELVHGTTKKSVKPLLFYGMATLTLTYLLWPALWENPIHHFAHSLVRMSDFPWRYSTLLMGEMVKATENPWYYIPLWMGITIPILVLASYIAGVIFGLGQMIKNISLVENKTAIFTLAIILLPIDLLLLFLFLKPTFYDGWRHLFFLYPLIILGGIFALNQWRLWAKKSKILTLIFYVSALVLVLTPAIEIIQLHPYQQVYFNALACKKDQQLRQQYEMDYWGLSYKEGFEQLLELDNSPHIKVMVSNIAGIDNWRLTQGQSSRIELVENMEEADYFISNYRFHPEEYPQEKVIDVRRHNSSILAVFSLNNGTKRQP